MKKKNAIIGILAPILIAALLIAISAAVSRQYYSANQEKPKIEYRDLVKMQQKYAQ